MQEFSEKSIYVAGHQGMVGQALVRALKARGAENLILKSRSELDLCCQAAVSDFFQTERPEIVFFAAAKVGGIHANSTYPAEFLYQNLTMAVHAIDAAYRSSVQRFLYLGSTCIYPQMANQPLQEDSLLTGPLEATNEAYAIAKIAGLKLCQFYRHQYGVTFHSAMPTNLYGPGDNYHPENSHVLPALLRRFHEAKKSHLESVTIWGSGNPRREFLHVDDLATGLLHLIQLTNPPDWVNIGTGIDCTILELAQTIARVVGYRGKIVTDPSKPDGTPVKRTDVSRLKAAGWMSKIDLETGLKSTYQRFLAELESGEVRHA